VNLNEMLTEYARLDSESCRLEEEKKKTDKERDTVELAIMEQYTNDGITSSRVSGLGSFVKTTMTRASIKADKKSEAIERFKKHFPDLVQETINAQTLSGFVSSSKKNDQEIPAEILECLNVFQKEYISWKR
jgi:hypothetical protein